LKNRSYSNELEPHAFKFKYEEYTWKVKFAKIKIVLPHANQGNDVEMADDVSNLNKPSSEDQDEEMEDNEKSEKSNSKPPQSDIDRPISTRVKNKEKEQEIEKIAEKLKAHEEKVKEHQFNMKQIFGHYCVVDDIECFQKKVENHLKQMVIRVNSSDYFSSAYNLFIRNDVIEQSNIQGKKYTSSNCEIALNRENGDMKYRFTVNNDTALIVTANSNFFVVFFKTGVIGIYDLFTGTKINHFGRGMKVFAMASYSDGQMAILTLEGLLTIANVYNQQSIVEENYSVMNLLSQLKTEDLQKFCLKRPNVTEKKTNINVTSIYLQKSQLYMNVENCNRNEKKLFSYNLLK
jgi:hypothetical protein